MKHDSKQSDAGQAIVVLVVAMVGLLVVVGLAVDGGTVYLQRRRMQNAADAAAREGTRQLYGWQVRVAYPDDSSAEQAVLSAVHTVAEANAVPDTDGTLGNTVNDNIIAYYVDSEGVQLSNTPIGQGGSLDDCVDKKCAPQGSGRCCGVRVEVQTEFDTALIGLVGAGSAPVEAAAAAKYAISDGLEGLGDSALYALGSGCCEEQITLRGDDVQIIGTAHSNHGVWIPNDRPDIDRLEYVNTGGCVSITGDDPRIDEEEDFAAPVNPNLPYDTKYYLDYIVVNSGVYHGGGWTISSDQTGLHRVDGDMVVQGDNIDLKGLYYVDGNVTVQGDNATLIETTIVATGWIDIRSDDVPYSPWPHSWGIALYSEYDPADKCSDSDAGIVLHGNNPNREGVFYAPRSRITLDAQTGYIKGTFIGWSISIDGDGWTIEKWRPAWGAVGELEGIVLVR